MRFGVDIGGTTVKIGLVDNYKVLDSYEIKTNKNTLFSDICISINDYIAKNNIVDVECIGFGVPGNVVDNLILFMPNIGLKDIDLNKEVARYFPSVKIFSNNDANAAALGETLNDGSFLNSYMITLGTGVGGGYVYNGRVVNGRNAACGEIGHIFIDPLHNYKCTCGLCGCLETVASATGIVRLAKEYFNKFETKLDFNNITCKDVLDSARDKDLLGEFVLDTVSKYLAHAIANIAVTVDVEVFYIGGGVAACGDLLLNRIKRYYSEYSHYAVKDTEIRLAKLGNLAGILGAAYLK